MINYEQAFKDSNMTYVDIAWELGCCEQTARNKMNGKTRITKAESAILDKLFSEKENETYKRR